jgi:hypothetical protein
MVVGTASQVLLRWQPAGRGLVYGSAASHVQLLRRLAHWRTLRAARNERSAQRAE